MAFPDRAYLRERLKAVLTPVIERGLPVADAVEELSYAAAEIEAAAANDELALTGVRPMNGAAH